MEWHEADGVRWLEACLPGARAAFSTRLGGTSGAPFDSLNVGLKTDDDPEHVKQNRLRLAAALGRDAAGVLMNHQVHGDRLVRSESAPQPSPYADAVEAPEQADAQATAAAELTPLVQVADCLPVALAGPDGVVMAHGGWRGLAAGILEKAAAEVGATAAAIGPGIGQCCYEVGEEVLQAFAAYADAADGRMLDLTAVARQQLAGAGVESVEPAGLCTSCNPDLFFSHRRDNGLTGRQAGLVWMER
jgi:purine-nucleoside/S-methyl-5'-thioadenosine phosphorylase / adenosine deaminase